VAKIETVEQVGRLTEKLIIELPYLNKATIEKTGIWVNETLREL